MVSTIGLRKRRAHRGLKRECCKTYVGIILDRSGSMGHLADEVVEAFNDQVDAIKKMAREQEVVVSFVTFSTFVDSVTILHKNVRSLKPLRRNQYRPGGMTALYDAMGDTIYEFEQVEDYDDPDVAFLLIVITDGEENNSKRFNNHKLRRAVERTEADGRWTITYLGTNQDVWAVAQEIGLKIGNVGSWDHSTGGLREASLDLTRSIGTYGESRLAGTVTSNSFYVDTKVGNRVQEDESTVSLTTKIETNGTGDVDWTNNSTDCVTTKKDKKD